MVTIIFNFRQLRYFRNQRCAPSGPLPSLKKKLIAGKSKVN